MAGTYKKRVKSANRHVLGKARDFPKRNAYVITLSNDPDICVLRPHACGPLAPPVLKAIKNYLLRNFEVSEHEISFTGGGDKIHAAELVMYSEKNMTRDASFMEYSHSVDVNRNHRHKPVHLQRQVAYGQLLRVIAAQGTPSKCRKGPLRPALHPVIPRYETCSTALRTPQRMRTRSFRSTVLTHARACASPASRASHPHTPAPFPSHLHRTCARRTPRTSPASRASHPHARALFPSHTHHTCARAPRILVVQTFLPDNKTEASTTLTMPATFVPHQHHVSVHSAQIRVIFKAVAQSQLWPNGTEHWTWNHLRASPPLVSLHALLTPLRTRGSAARTTMLYAWACVTGLYINKQVQQKKLLPRKDYVVRMPAAAETLDFDIALVTRLNALAEFGFDTTIAWCKALLMQVPTSRMSSSEVFGCERTPNVQSSIPGYALHALHEYACARFAAILPHPRFVLDMDQSASADASESDGGDSTSASTVLGSFPLFSGGGGGGDLQGLGAARVKGD
ncbi:hypothetical protein B0H14DRAFT_2654617 [Mycena olivaceomarginata]|nr:hypothetical protein B0H14DRAFT_2654617 [Mycena olivaceomarginata]